MGGNGVGSIASISSISDPSLQMGHYFFDYGETIVMVMVTVTLNPALLDRIRGINWFHNVGKPLEGTQPIKVYNNGSFIFGP